MAYFDDINEALFKLGDLGTLASRDITQSITEMSVSLTLSGSSQVAVSVVDPNFAFAKANYFQIRRDIFYRDMWFEIAAVETSRGESIHPLYSLECRSKAVQLMKRDKKPEAYRGMTGYDFAQAMAKRFALNFVGERTTKKQSIVKGKGKDSDDSVWTVLQSLAGEQKFICFETEGTLFFCSEKFLLGKWGDPNFAYGDFKFIPFVYPEPNTDLFPSAKDKYVLLDQPRVRRSDDDIKAAEGSILVDRANGIKLRPGQTIYLAGIPDFEAFYIITDVSFREGSAEPVQVQFRVPVDPTKEKISTNGTKQTPGANTQPSTSTNPPPGVPNIKIPVALSPTAAMKYAEEVLRRQRFRGPGEKIKRVVYEAILGLLNRRTAEQVIASINKDTRITGYAKLTRDIVFSYVLGIPSTRFGVSGGLTTSESAREEANFIKRFGAQTSTPVPTKTSQSSKTGADYSSTTPGVKSTTKTSADQLSSGSIPIPKQETPPSSLPKVNLPVEAIVAIGQALRRDAPSDIDGPRYSRINQDIIANALQIYNIPDIANKAKKMNTYYSIYRDPASQFKYNALYASWPYISGGGFSSIKLSAPYTIRKR